MKYTHNDTDELEELNERAEELLEYGWQLFKVSILAWIVGVVGLFIHNWKLVVMMWAYSFILRIIAEVLKDKATKIQYNAVRSFRKKDD